MLNVAAGTMHGSKEEWRETGEYLEAPLRDSEPVSWRRASRMRLLCIRGALFG
jgi:hypothetical protein